METIVEYITPEIAKWYLSHNDNNRKLSKNIVNQYCESIKNGEWKLNGESIKFDTEGKLLDGQHRLNAIIKAGIGINTCVARGLDREVFVTIDIGKKRTAGDCLSIQGITNCNNLASIIRCYLKMKKTESSSFFGERPEKRNVINYNINDITNTQVTDEYYLHQEEYDEITRIAKNCYKDLRLLPISFMGSYMAFMILSLGKDKEKVFDFFKQLTMGDNIKSDAMAYFHKLLIRRANKVIELSPGNIDKYIKQVWNMNETGKDVSKVMIKKDKKYIFV